MTVYDGTAFFKEKDHMLFGLIRLLGYVSLDAEELEAQELVEAVDRAIVIASRHVLGQRFT